MRERKIAKAKTKIIAGSNCSHVTFTYLRKNIIEKTERKNHSYFGSPLQSHSSTSQVASFLPRDIPEHSNSRILEQER